MFIGGSYVNKVFAKNSHRTKAIKATIRIFKPGERGYTKLPELAPGEEKEVDVYGGPNPREATVDGAQFK